MQKTADDLLEDLKKKTLSSGYLLSNDTDLLFTLCNGLLLNEERYGYQACPCRRVKGNKEEDLDIICPCDYRDGDLETYGSCYCGLYVSKEIFSGEISLTSIPESRPTSEERKLKFSKSIQTNGLPLQVWRCKVCGYLCAREAPPAVCPICKVEKERFEIFRII